MTRAVKSNGRAWAEIRLGALEHNLRAIRRHIDEPSGGKRKLPRKGRSADNNLPSRQSFSMVLSFWMIEYHVE